MRCIKIPNCEYKTFEAIRDAIFDEIPFVLLNQGYSKKLKVAIFNFWDECYIIEELKSYIVQPPLSRENVPELINKIKGALSS